MCRVVAYFRVSTEAQGRSGLGLEAQREAVTSLCRERGWEIIADYTEVESGKRSDRPELIKALHCAKVTGATLTIAKLDRLSRDAAFLLNLQNSGAKFVAADMPEACHLTVGIMALVAQQEREAISSRTKAALAAAKARGHRKDGQPFKAGRLGNPNGPAALKRAAKGNAAALSAIKARADGYAQDLAEIIADLRANGITSLPAIAKALKERKVCTPRGGEWYPSSVRNLLLRIEGAQSNGA